MTDTENVDLAELVRDLVRAELRSVEAPTADPLAIPPTGRIPAVVDGQIIESAWGNMVAGRTVTPFATLAERNAATGMAAGSECYVIDIRRSYVWTGSAWLDLSPAAAYYTDRADLYANQTDRYAVYFPSVTGQTVPGVMVTRSTSSWYGAVHLRISATTNASGVAQFTAATCGLTNFLGFSCVPEFSGTATLQQFGTGRMTSATTAEGRAYGNSGGNLVLLNSTAITWNVIASGLI